MAPELPGITFLDVSDQNSRRGHLLRRVAEMNDTQSAPRGSPFRAGCGEGAVSPLWSGIRGEGRH